MDESYHTSVDGIYEFQLKPDDIGSIDEAKLSEENMHLLYNSKSFSFELLENDFINRKYSVKVNGNTYQITIKTPLDQLIDKMGLSLGNDSVANEIHAPMPGIILEVLVAEGDTVKKGDFLCILEAMKMENTLSAPRDGIIKSITFSKGETVEKGKLLIEFE